MANILISWRREEHERSSRRHGDGSEDESDETFVAKELINHLRQYFSTDRVWLGTSDAGPFAWFSTDRVWWDTTDAGPFAWPRSGRYDVLIVFIDRRWLAAEGSQRRQRIEEPDDLVIASIREALASKRIVIPVLLEDAPMSVMDRLRHEIAGLVFVPVRRRSFDADFMVLVRTIERARRTRQVFVAVALGAATIVATAATVGTVSYLRPSAGTPDQPVYNAFLFPQYTSPGMPRDAPLLPSGRPTTLTFGIGPKWLGTDKAQSVNPGIKDSADDVPLTVRMQCGFCQSPGTLTERLVYRARDRQSNVVRFNFVPKASTGSTDGRETLVLSVTHDRSQTEYDRLSIPVLVADVPEATAQLAQPRPPLAIRFQGEARRFLRDEADVVLAAYHHPDGRIRIEMHVARPDLIAAVDSFVSEGPGHPRVFTTDVGRDEIKSIAASAYHRTASVPSAEDARRLGAVVFSADSLKTSRLKVTEANAVAEAVALSGQALYRELFLKSGTRPLAEAIRRLEEFPAARPLRVLIYTDLSLPWQYLHRSGPVNAKNFWGMQFSLAVVRTNISAPALSASLGNGDARLVIFARQATAVDATASGADGQIDLLKKLSRVKIVESRDDFRSVLSGDRNDIGAVFAFLHASSTEVTASSAHPVSPRLYFAPKNWIAVEDVVGLLGTLSAEEVLEGRRYLAGAPLVILNACETAPSALALPYQGLDSAMLQLGANGVIATEVPVWIPFGDEVGRRLIAKLGEGYTASEALTAIRRELLAEYNNPLGLLYAYYGGPSSALRR